MFNVTTIEKILLDFLNGTPATPVSSVHVNGLIRSLIQTNQILWNLEDSARIEELGAEHVAKEKKKIDKYNQIRNDLIRKIDIEISKQLHMNTALTQEQLYIESPAMIIDRLSILFIKRFVIRKLLTLIKNDDFFAKYSKKQHLIDNQIQKICVFLESFFNKVKKHEVYFEIQDPVKIYNDKRIKDFIKISKVKKSRTQSGS